MRTGWGFWAKIITGACSDVYTDITRQSAVSGTHLEMLEMCELKRFREQLTEDDVNAKLGEFRSNFEVSPECEDSELGERRRSAALDRMVETHRLGAMAYYYEGEGAYEDIATSISPGIRCQRRGIPVAGECEVKNAQAMKILSLLGAGGSFSEFYAMDFNDDIVMLGHDGPAHFEISEGRVGLCAVAGLSRQARKGPFRFRCR